MRCCSLVGAAVERNGPTFVLRAVFRAWRGAWWMDVEERIGVEALNADALAAAICALVDERCSVERPWNGGYSEFQWVGWVRA